MTRIIFFACFILSGLANISYTAETSQLDRLPGVYKAKVSKIFRYGDEGSSAERTAIFTIEKDDEEMMFAASLSNPEKSSNDNRSCIDDEFIFVPDRDSSSEDDSLLFQKYIDINGVEFILENNYDRIGFQKCTDDTYIPFSDKIADDAKWVYQFKFINGKLSSARLQKFKNKNVRFCVELTDMVLCNSAKSDWNF